MRMRVLHVVPDLVPYGLENVVRSLMVRADRDRFQPAVVSLYSEREDSLAEPLRREGFDVFHLDKRRGFDPRMLWRFARVIEQWRPHVIHSHNYVLRYTLAPALWHRVPVCVHTVHNVADKEVDRAGVMLQRWAFRRRVHAVAIAQEVRASFARVYGREPAAMIANGIPVEGYASPRMSRMEWRRMEGFDAGDLLVVCVARFYEQKNHEALIEAFAQVASAEPRARLALAGQGHLQDAVERQVRELGITDRVRFLGQREDIAELLSAADAFALASLWEGNPLSVMEAMAAGLPVVATAVGAVPELIEDGRSGLLVEPGDVAALGQALARVLGNEKLRDAMGASARVRARERFDERVMVHSYERLYDRLGGHRCEQEAMPASTPAGSTPAGSTPAGSTPAGMGGIA